ncbi:MAG: DUF937 domain-containing protein [Hyphomicrobium sp.]|jgi:hypothetical protein
MSTNLVASAVKLLSPELLSRVGSVLGVDQSTIEKAVSAGVPGVLAAFASVASRPTGAARLADAVRQQQPGLLNNISTAGQAAQRNLIDSGSGALSSVLGSGTLSGITDALSRYTGLSESAAKGILGLIGPMVMSVLGQHVRSDGLDSSGLAQLLQSQKNNIVRAMPSGFGEELGDSGVLDQVGTMSGRRGAGDADYRSQRSWLAPALAVVALGALAWYFFGRHADESVATLPPAANIQAQAPQAQNFIVTADEEKNWIGRPVFSRDNEKVGEIIEIKRGPGDKVTDVYFDAGTFLGMGANRYHITSEQIEEVKPSGLVVSLKESEVKALPHEAGTPMQ